MNFYNPQRRAPLNTVPGLVGVILTMTLVMFTAIALVRERERGNLEMLIATPVSPWELTIGKVLPFVLIGLVQVTVVLALGALLFGVPVRGSLARALPRRARVHRREPGARHLPVDAREDAVPGDADVVLHVPAADPAVRASCSRTPACRRPRSGSRRSCRSRISCGSCAASCCGPPGSRDLWPSLAALGVFIVVMLTIAVSRVRKRLD